MNFNEILDYEGRLLILNNETKSLKPVPTVKMPPTKQLRHQESIYLEDYMDTSIQPYFNRNPIPLQVFKKEVYDSNSHELLDGQDGNTPDELWRICAGADLNDDKALDYNEFKLLICSPKTCLNEQQVRFLNRVVRNAAKSIQMASESLPKNRVQIKPNVIKFIPRHYFILILSCLQISVFIVYRNKLHENNNPFIFDPQKRHEIWRFLTYMLLHSGYLHLILNVLVQLIFGIPLEYFLKSWRVAIIFVLGVILGSIVGLQVASEKKMIGSSAGAYAVSFALFTYFVMNWCEKKRQKIGLFTVLICLVSVLEILFYISRDDFDNENYLVHLSGALIGALAGLFFIYKPYAQSGQIMYLPE